MTDGQAAMTDTAETAETAETASRFEHGGSAGGYRNHGCRCDLCKAAHAAANQRTRAAAKKRASMPPDEPHGVERTYDVWHCRCEACRRAASIVRLRNRLAELEAEHAASR